jgi:hypothetical protein
MGYIRDWLLGEHLAGWHSRTPLNKSSPSILHILLPCEHFHTSRHGSIPLDKSSPAMLHILLPDGHFHTSIKKKVHIPLYLVG